MRTAIRPENVSGIHRLLFELFSLIIDTHTRITRTYTETTRVA